MESLGRIAYQGYFKRCGGKSLISGAALPTWEAQSEEIREAWDAAAGAVVAASAEPPPSQDGVVIIERIVGCARCGGNHSDVDARPMTQPFAPPEAGGVAWTHWSPCQVNGQPILFVISNDDAADRAS